MFVTTRRRDMLLLYHSARGRACRAHGGKMLLDTRGRCGAKDLVPNMLARASARASSSLWNVVKIAFANCSQLLCSCALRDTHVSKRIICCVQRKTERDSHTNICCVCGSFSHTNVHVHIYFKYMVYIWHYIRMAEIRYGRARACAHATDSGVWWRRGGGVSVESLCVCACVRVCKASFWLVVRTRFTYTDTTENRREPNTEPRACAACAQCTEQNTTPNAATSRARIGTHIKM